MSCRRGFFPKNILVCYCSALHSSSPILQPMTTDTDMATPSARLLPNKVVVVTGSSSGIGRATAIGEDRAPGLN
jgi:hypothetical protein